MPILQLSTIDKSDQFNYFSLIYEGWTYFFSLYIGESG